MPKFFQDSPVIKSISNFLTTLHLRLATSDKFASLMAKKYTADKTPRRIALAIKELEKTHSKETVVGELTWALAEASHKGNFLMVNFLLAAGAKANGGPRHIRTNETDPMMSYPLLAAVNGMSTGQIFKTLVEAGARIGVDRALYEVLANRRDFEIADYLIKKTGVSINAMDGKIVRTIIGDYGHRPRAYFQGTFPYDLQKKAMEFISDAGADFNAAAAIFRKEHEDDSPDLFRIAQHWAQKQKLPKVPAALPVTTPGLNTASPAVAANIGAGFAKGTGKQIIAPETARFRPKNKR